MEIERTDDKRRLLADHARAAIEVFEMAIDDIEHHKSVQDVCARLCPVVRALARRI